MPPPSHGCEASTPASIRAMWAGLPPAAGRGPGRAAGAGDGRRRGAGLGRREEGHRDHRAHLGERRERLEPSRRHAHAHGVHEDPRAEGDRRAQAPQHRGEGVLGGRDLPGGGRAPLGRRVRGGRVGQDQDHRLGVAGRRQLRGAVVVEGVAPAGRGVQRRRAHRRRVGGGRHRAGGRRRRLGRGRRGRDRGRRGAQDDREPQRDGRPAAGTAAAHAAMPPGGAVATASSPRYSGQGTASVNWAAAPIMAALSVQSDRSGDRHPQPGRGGARRHQLAQAPVGRHAAPERDGRHALGDRRRDQPVGERPHDGLLVRGGEVGALALAQVAGLAEGVEQRGLHPREREVTGGAALEPDREAVGGGVAPARQALQRGAARVAEAEQPRALVDGLPRRVVDRLAERPGAGVVGHQVQAGVAARGDQADEGRVERHRLQPDGRDVPVEVVDHDQGQAGGVGERLGRRDAHQQRADQARALGDGHRVDLGQGQAGALERRVDDGVHRPEVVAGRDLGHDAAVGGVQVGLRRDDARDDLPSPHDRRGGLVTRGLDRQDRPGPQRSSSGPPSRHMMMASSPLSE